MPEPYIPNKGGIRHLVSQDVKLGESCNKGQSSTLLILRQRITLETALKWVIMKHFRIIRWWKPCHILASQDPVCINRDWEWKDFFDGQCKNHPRHGGGVRHAPDSHICAEALECCERVGKLASCSEPLSHRVCLLNAIMWLTDGVHLNLHNMLCVHQNVKSVYSTACDNCFLWPFCNISLAFLIFVLRESHVSGDTFQALGSFQWFLHALNSS